MNEMVKHEGGKALVFSTEQRQMILDTFLSGASPAEAEVLMELARVRRLNPITRQIHFVKRWDNTKKREVWSAQVGIDGFRTIAERTGFYEGQDEPEYEYDKAGKLALCRVRVYRKGWVRPCVGVAHFSEYAQTYQDKQTAQKRLTAMWAEKPHVMLAKCAEALALRKAFPDDLAGIYGDEEMEGRGLNEERELNAPPAPVMSAKVAAALAPPSPPAMPSPPKARRMAVQPTASEVAAARVIEHLGGQAEEPPPPGDEDAPPDFDAPPSPPRQRAARPDDGAVFPNYGASKGQPVSGAAPRDLAFYAGGCRKSLADPGKERFHAKERALLASIEAEARAQGVEL